MEVVMRGSGAIAFVGATLIAAFSSPAGAITGAQLRAEEEGLGQGYVFGVVEMYLSALPKDDPMRECITSGRFTEGSLYQAIASYIDNHPNTLTKRGTDVVLEALGAICET